MDVEKTINKSHTFYLNFKRPIRVHVAHNHMTPSPSSHVNLSPVTQPYYMYAPLAERHHEEFNTSPQASYES